MRQVDWRYLRNLGFGVIAVLFALAVVVTFLSYSANAPENPVLLAAWQNHVLIMLVLVVLSVSFGFASAALAYNEVRKNQKATRSVLEVVLPFMQHDERSVIDYLVKHGGSATQADLARVSGMTRLRAFRSVQKLLEKGIVFVEPHGKVRNIRLKEGLLELLTESE